MKSPIDIAPPCPWGSLLEAPENLARVQSPPLLLRDESADREPAERPLSPRSPRPWLPQRALASEPGESDVPQSVLHGMPRARVFSHARTAGVSASIRVP